MTISNHVNFEKLLLKLFDTKYKSIEVVGGDLHSGQFQWNDVEAGEDSSRHVVLKRKKRILRLGLKRPPPIVTE
jgi:hypothetical protein